MTLDNCCLCHGANGGVPGNENVVAGHVVCDDCHAVIIDALREDRDHRVTLLGGAVHSLLVRAGVVPPDSDLTGPELILATETYLRDAT